MTNITKAAQDALKPCPFCGSSAAQYPDGDMEGHSIMCSGDRLEIGASCPMTAFGYATEAEAAERWNIRAALQDKAVEVRGEREAFEAFAQNCPMGRYNVTRKGEGYDSSHTQIMWDTWQARAAQPAPVVPDDVVRYRTIRDGLAYIEPHESGEIYVAGETGVYTKSGDEFDAAIDAIAASQQKGSAG